MLLGGDSSSEEGGDAPRQRQQRAPAPTPPLIAPPQLTGLAHRVQQLREREWLVKLWRVIFNIVR